MGVAQKWYPLPQDPVLSFTLKKVKSFSVNQVNQSTEKLNRLQQDLKEVEEKIANQNKLLDLNQVEMEIRSSEAKRDK